MKEKAVIGSTELVDFGSERKKSQLKLIRAPIPVRFGRVIFALIKMVY